VTSDKVHIIGIGDDAAEGLTAAARQLIEEADVLLGSEQSLKAVSHSSGEHGAAKHVAVGSDLNAIVGLLEEHASRRVVILTTGDPLFYGTARYLCDRLGKDRFEVVPNVSTMQLAFARVKESWDEAYLSNLANQSLERVIDRIRTAETVGLFTTEETPPSAVAAGLLDRKIDYFTAYICENLGSPDERVTSDELSAVAGQEFAPLNVMILVRKPDVPDRPTSMVGRRLFGNHDDAFLQSKPKHGLLTSAEVRTIALAEMDVGSASIVWDVGAGSGSVAVEAAQISQNGHVYAIEMDAEDYQLISANAERFGTTNLTPILGNAPDAWADLPDPDAIFVGGTGRTIGRIVEEAYERLRLSGRLVANVASIENVASVSEVLRRLSGDAGVWMISISRGVHQFERLRFESLNPTFLIGAVKE
jgi:precorrin-6Y C5,15-methyltransferase (decarboxylating)